MLEKMLETMLENLENQWKNVFEEDLQTDWFFGVNVLAVLILLPVALVCFGSGHNVLGYLSIVVWPILPNLLVAIYALIYTQVVICAGLICYLTQMIRRVRFCWNENVSWFLRRYDRLTDRDFDLLIYLIEDYKKGKRGLNIKLTDCATLRAIARKLDKDDREKLNRTVSGLDEIIMANYLKKGITLAEARDFKNYRDNGKTRAIAKGNFIAQGRNVSCPIDRGYECPGTCEEYKSCQKFIDGTYRLMQDIVEKAEKEDKAKAAEKKKKSPNRNAAVEKVCFNKYMAHMGR